jgi:SfnB family sulfur acquisition oxidoreductase
VSVDVRAPVKVIGDDAEALAAAGAFAAEVADGAIDRDIERAIPIAELERLAQTGLLGITVPKEYGGAGVSTETLTEVFRLISAVDPAIGQIPQNHFCFVESITWDGTEEQKQLFYPQFLAGARLGNALSERGGRTPMDFKTTLEPDPEGGYRLNGSKYYCTGALTAQLIPVFFFDADKRVHIAYVPRDSEGLTAEQDWSAMGQRATMSGTVTLEDVHVKSEWIVPHWRAYERPQVYGAFGQIMHAAVDVGIARNALEDGAEFIRTRTRPWFESDKETAAEDPVLLHRFGQLATKVNAAEALLVRAARAIDAAGREDIDAEAAAAASLAVAEAKAFGADVAVEVSSEIFEYAGTASTDARYDLDRHWRNARTHSLHDPGRWKYIHAGNYVVTGTPPPNHALI